ncbi:arabinose transporter [Acidomonas methanolica]|uniref:arabinose transporter n=1 Tax=Acidomonas methanolica TaxID=437 RepID=UPI002119ECFE|nr:arabinose transporter [Acidomonas methanolica]MCQ9156173.1 arabinose transporter [Acidomonas methanolica]
MLRRIGVLLFLSYLAVAMSLPTTSLFVREQLHMSNGLAGLAVGIAFLSTIFSRAPAGKLADRFGGKRAVIIGMLLYVAAAGICATAAFLPVTHFISFAVLLSGRIVLGLGESFTVVGVLSWGFGLMGGHRAGRVLTVVGMAMYGALAVGSLLGLDVMHRAGYAGMSAACASLPLIGLALALPLAAAAPHHGRREPMHRLLGRIWDLGMVVFLQGIGFAVIGAFMPLLFLVRHWPHVALGLTAFGAAFVLVRVFCGHLPDRIGGAKVAAVSLAVETTGQALILFAATPGLALIGAFLTGAGCSMMFPAMGVEVIRRIPAHLRGTAMGVFSAFQDLAYGATGPLTGLLADRYGYGSVFLVGTIAAALGLAGACNLIRLDRRDSDMPSG